MYIYKFIVKNNMFKICVYVCICVKYIDKNLIIFFQKIKLFNKCENL